MNDTVKKVMWASGITASAAAAASLSAYATTKYLVKIALDRQMPVTIKGADKLISGAQIDEKFLCLLEETADKLAEKENEIVEITAHDGTTLVGHWIPHKNAKRVIVAMHGWRSTWNKDFGMAADFWEENGCSVLYAEQRGQNNSGGDYMGFGLIERYDCLDWIHWVNKRCGGTLPIYLGGVSMGATTVLMATGLDLPANVHGVVADCGFTSPHAIWKYIANNNLHILFEVRGSIADALCKKKIRMGTDEYSTVDALKNCTVPVMLVHGTDDQFVPVEMTYENYKACIAPKRLFVVPGAGHGMSYYIDKAGYETAVKNFWKEFD